MAEEKFVVDGFCFKTKAEAIEAKNEYDGVQYMRSRTNTKSPASVYSVYRNIIDKKLFKTPVGIKYLCELRNILVESGKYSDEELEQLSIPVSGTGESKKAKEKKEKRELTKKDVIRHMKSYDIESHYRNRFINAVILNVILIIVIILIISIAGNGDNINILNYKNRIDAEYEDREDTLAQWEKELSIREDYIKQREKELENAPAVD